MFVILCFFFPVLLFANLFMNSQSACLPLSTVLFQFFSVKTVYFRFGTMRWLKRVYWTLTIQKHNTKVESKVRKENVCHSLLFLSCIVPFTVISCLFFLPEAHGDVYKNPSKVLNPLCAVNMVSSRELKIVPKLTTLIFNFVFPLSWLLDVKGT